MGYGAFGEQVGEIRRQVSDGGFAMRLRGAYGKAMSACEQDSEGDEHEECLCRTTGDGQHCCGEPW